MSSIFADQISMSTRVADILFSCNEGYLYGKLVTKKHEVKGRFVFTQDIVLTSSTDLLLAVFDDLESTGANYFFH